MKIVIEIDDFQYNILNEIGSARWNKALEGQSQEFKSGAMWGMSWAGLLTTECKQYCVSKEENEDAKV